MLKSLLGEKLWFVSKSLCNHLSSKTRLLKVVLANLVLRNANLSQEVWVLRRLLHQYELATSQDLLALMKWFVGQLNLPIGNATGGGEQQLRAGLDYVIRNT